MGVIVDRVFGSKDTVDSQLKLIRDSGVEGQDRIDLIEKVLMFYAPRQITIHTITFVTIAGYLLLNLIIFATYVYGLVSGNPSITEGIIPLLTFSSKMLMWIVAPILAYYFGSGIIGLKINSK